MNCTRCSQEISRVRLQQVPVVCDHCGQVATNNEIRVEKRIQKSYLIAIILFSTLTLLSFVQLSSWGRYAITASYLQVGEWTRLNSRTSSEKMAEICYELKKWSCLERIYAQLTTHGQATDLLRLGKFLMAREKYKEAATAYQRYIAKGGKDLDAHYNFARALAETGRMKEAIPYFEATLKAKPGVLQVTVVQNYVRYLVRNNQLPKAREVIQRVRAQGSMVSGFMETELKAISAQMGAQRT